jgi:hypothetical protein
LRHRKGKERKGKERKGKERKGKERKGKEGKGKERKGKERKGKIISSVKLSTHCLEVPCKTFSLLAKDYEEYGSRHGKLADDGIVGTRNTSMVFVTEYLYATHSLCE